MTLLDNLDQSNNYTLNKTYKLDLFRAVMLGILDCASSTFFMLFAVSCFQTPFLAKSLLGSMTSAGFLLCPVAILIAGKTHRYGSQAASLLNYMGATSLAISAFTETSWSYVIAVFIGCVIASASLPFYTQIIQDNYPHNIRGKLFSRIIMVRVITTIIVGYVLGSALQGNLEYFRYVLIVFAVTMFTNGVLLSKYPSRRHKILDGDSLFSGFRFLKTDPVFRRTIIVWMFIGFGIPLLTFRWPIR